MSSFLEFSTAIMSHPLIKWELWPTYGTLGVLLAAIAGLMVELLHFRSGPPVDLGRRSYGALTWERARVRREIDDRRGLLELAASEQGREGAGWRMEARSRACFEQNGDFFDTVELDEDHLAFFLGDVAGRGLPAALYQASCLALLRYATTTPGQAAQALEEVNSVLCQREQDGRFATLLYGVLEVSTGKVSLVSAGHTPPIIQRADGSTRCLPMPLRLPLGMAAHPEYKAVEMTLEKGDRLMIYSDGMTEARDRARRPFGEKRLVSAGHQGRDQELGDWVDSVMHSVDQYNFRRIDDRTVMALSYEGPREEQETENE